MKSWRPASRGTIANSASYRIYSVITMQVGKKKARAERYYTEIFDTPSPIDLARTRRRVKQLADEIRAVIEPVVIRRNRLDLKNDPVYAKEVTELSQVEDTRELFYELTQEQSAFYDQ